MRFICSNGEDHRCHRLLSVLEFVQDTGVVEFFGEAAQVVALEDHKGDLCVHWANHHYPTIQQRVLFNAAWSHVGNEPFDNVSHNIAAKPSRFNVSTGEEESCCAECGCDHSRSEGRP